MNNLLNILEGTNFGSASRCSLREEHWSNLLASLLDARFSAPQLCGVVLASLIELAGISVDKNEEFSVERERTINVHGRVRRVDVVLSFVNGYRIFIENKVDRAYEDVLQLQDELDALGDDGHLIFLCPRGFSLLRGETKQLIVSQPKISHVRWLDLAKSWTSSDESVHEILTFVNEYWTHKEYLDFVWQVETIVEEKGWITFYPDEFKAAFIARFPHAYQNWVVTGGERGRKGAHARVTILLNGLTKKRPGQFRLELTGNSRPPLPSDWGYPIIYEHRVVLA